MNDNPFWLVSPISYEDAVKLADSELIKNFQRDPRRNEAKFWPNSQGVLTYLRQSLPKGSAIVNATGTQSALQKNTKIKAPVVVHKRVGQDIHDD